MLLSRLSHLTFHKPAALYQRRVEVQTEAEAEL